MNKGLLVIVIGLVVLVLLFGNYFMPSDDTNDDYYHPGDAVSMRVPLSGYIPTGIIEPSYVRYYLKNGGNEIVHTEDHMVSYKKLEILGWACYDEHQITIGAFPSEGVWTIDGELHCVAGIIDVPSGFPTTKTFYVAGDLMGSLFAPIYIYLGNPIVPAIPGKSITLPAPIYFIIITAIFMAYLSMSRYSQSARIARMVAEYSKKK